MSARASACVCVCVCVRERERECVLFFSLVLSGLFFFFNRSLNNMTPVFEDPSASNPKRAREKSAGVTCTVCSRAPASGFTEISNTS